MKRLVLAGAGHAHAEVLRRWARAPLAGVEVVVVSPTPRAPYSGMVPGWLAGTYRTAEIELDFAALCAAAGARFVAGTLDALRLPPAGADAKEGVGPVDIAAGDGAGRGIGDGGEVRLADGTAMPFDVLSLNVGSTLVPPALPEGVERLALRPLGALALDYGALLARWQAAPASAAPCRVTAVGGGAAGFESLLAVLARLRALRPDRRVQGRLISRGDVLLPGLADGARRAAMRALARAGVELRLDTDFSPALVAGAGAAVAREGGRDAGSGDEVVLWATGAQPHRWQTDAVRRGGLAVDGDGFIRVDDALRSPSHPQVHAAGDCAAWTQPLPKAGVHAVRMGPVLSDNLRQALEGGGVVQRHRPPARFLALLATADGRAIASRGGLFAQGRWVWRWKDRIDRGFVARYARAPVAGGPAPAGAG